MDKIVPKSSDVFQANLDRAAPLLAKLKADGIGHIIDGKVVPPLSAVFALEDVGEAAYEVHRNRHEGKIGVLCVAPREGLGITNPELRAKVGEKRLTIFRRHDKEL